MSLSANADPYDELIKEFRSGYAFIFDVLMDIGGWRDMHRHRRCQQIQQNFTTVHGYDVPPPLCRPGSIRNIGRRWTPSGSDIEQLKKASAEAIALCHAVRIQGAMSL